MTEPATRAQLGPHEIKKILGRYELGHIIEIRDFPRGSSKSPKAHVRTLEGAYLLKRRAPGRDDPRRIRFQHEVQLSLQEHGFPTAGLVRTKQNSNSIVKRGSRLYELFNFIEGKRFHGGSAQAHASGYEMARMHDHFTSFKGTIPDVAGFHEASNIQEGFERLPARLAPSDRELRLSLESSCYFLSGSFLEAHERLESLGIQERTKTIVHGDWHPGNLLYEGNDVAAVLDFDSARSEARVAEFANGALQFAMQLGDHENVDRWPDSLDMEMIRAMREGYDEGTFEPLEKKELAMVPWLMIEAMVVESLAPIAARGLFGSIPGDRFLQLIERKINWLRPRVDTFASDMGGE